MCLAVAAAVARKIESSLEPEFADGFGYVRFSLK